MVEVFGETYARPPPKTEKGTAATRTTAPAKRTWLWLVWLGVVSATITTIKHLGQETHVSNKNSTWWDPTINSHGFPVQAVGSVRKRNWSSVVEGSTGQRENVEFEVGRGSSPPHKGALSLVGR